MNKTLDCYGLQQPFSVGKTDYINRDNEFNIVFNSKKIVGFEKFSQKKLRFTVETTLNT